MSPHLKATTKMSAKIYTKIDFFSKFKKTEFNNKNKETD